MDVDLALAHSTALLLASLLAWVHLPEFGPVTHGRWSDTGPLIIPLEARSRPRPICQFLSGRFWAEDFEFLSGQDLALDDVTPQTEAISVPTGPKTQIFSVTSVFVVLRGFSVQICTIKHSFDAESDLPSISADPIRPVQRHFVRTGT
ncbi:hypothetical protein R3P38DRAFT_2807739 [Favolaschia claudopus]|uniref:Uncharacterized protein n=1 Tax=Favolaschia claudopus TaxID=2862362 RepID=A0AAV9ZIP8_9AGAR